MSIERYWRGSWERGSSRHLWPIFSTCVVPLLLLLLPCINNARWMSFHHISSFCFCWFVSWNISLHQLCLFRRNGTLTVSKSSLIWKLQIWPNYAKLPTMWNESYYKRAEDSDISGVNNNLITYSFFVCAQIIDGWREFSFPGSTHLLSNIS